MNRAEAWERSDTPLLREAALREPFAELGGAHALNGSYTAPGHPQPQAAPPPKTVAQVLAKIAWRAPVDDLAARRIDGGDRCLTAVEWKSVSNVRIVEIVAPFGREAEMRQRSSGY
ncbi:hypothetical protein [uncultured Bradyrhizobium sp.]|uniref:hypothetical protein n=1 Tax=uncultured Bradyrhizobium sp. TaxID=199684 RepID=UPI0035CAB3DB